MYVPGAVFGWEYKIYKTQLLPLRTSQSMARKRGATTTQCDKSSNRRKLGIPWASIEGPTRPGARGTRRFLIHVET